MRRLTIIFLLSGILVSCHSSKSLVNNISSVSLEIDRNETVNVGSSFEYVLLVQLKSGGQRKIKDDALVTIGDGMFTDAGKHQARTVGPLPNFIDSVFPISLKISIEEYEFEGIDSIQLNFKGPIIVNWPSPDGKDGVEPRASTATLFSRDGLEGRPGGDGEDGVTGRNIISYMWLEAGELRMVVDCDRCEEKSYYRSRSKDSIIVTLNGGNGGDGGTGGKGGNGKPGKEAKPPGNGADGGTGGNAGNGGEGGSMLIFIHPEAAYLNESISLSNLGGNAGTPGKGGAPGLSGKPMKNQEKRLDGKQGESGKEGTSGKTGPSVKYSIVEFSVEQLLNQ